MVRWCSVWRSWSHFYNEILSHHCKKKKSKWVIVETNSVKFFRRELTYYEIVSRESRQLYVVKGNLTIENYGQIKLDAISGNSKWQNKCVWSAASVLRRRMRDYSNKTLELSSSSRYGKWTKTWNCKRFRIWHLIWKWIINLIKKKDRLDMVQLLPKYVFKSAI